MDFPSSHHLFQVLLPPFEEGKGHTTGQVHHRPGAVRGRARQASPRTEAPEQARRDDRPEDGAECDDPWEEYRRGRRHRESGPPEDAGGGD